MFLALSSLASLVMLGCAIFVLIQMNAKEGLAKAILGFICFIYGLYWGFQNRDVHPQMQNVLIAYLVAFVVSMVSSNLAY